MIEFPSQVPAARRDRPRPSRRRRWTLIVFRKILIANRGEIALRILRACRVLGVEAVVAYSEADRDSLAVQLADEAICIGPADAKRSYLSALGGHLGGAGHRLRRDPPGLRLPVRGRGLRRGGRGPRADLHRAAGRGPRALRQQGRDARAARPRTACRRSPARTGCSATRCTPSSEAERIGYPVLIKPSAGGGGKGMRMVRTPRELESVAAGLPLGGQGRLRRRLALPREVARREPPRRGPGRGRSLRPRRPPRRARLLGPAPPPEDHRGGAHAGPVRRRPGRARRAGDRARRWPPATRTSGRSSSWSTRTGGFYFIEINCRIQVEHPVTEMLTGIDMVATQIRIAAGEPLGFSQAGRDASRPCHRVPDQRRGRGPRLPAERRHRSSATTRRAGPGVRIDSHLYSGYDVPPFYDSLLGKLIVWGPDRASAIARSRVALDELVDRRARDQRRDPPGAAAQRDVPRGQDDDQPARPRRERGVPGRRGTHVSRPGRSGARVRDAHLHRPPLATAERRHCLPHARSCP